jgi:predicted transglutaminase-like cysteine proteinase
MHAQNEDAVLRNTVIIVATALALGSTVFSAAAFGPPPLPTRAGSDHLDDGSHKVWIGHQSGIGVSPGGERVPPHRSKVDESEISAKWEDLQFRMRPEEKIIATCRMDINSCSQAARRFLEIVELGRQREGRARLGEINRAVNLRIKPASDWLQHGVDDFWSTPLTTLGMGAGDCEDYAVLKYAALRELGIAPNDMRLLIVRDRRSSNHAVLAVRDDNQWLILDNRTLVLAKADDVRHYDYLVVLDHRGARPFEAVAFR